MIAANFLAGFSKAGEGGDVMNSVTAAQSLTQDLGRVLAPDMPAKVKYDRIYRKLVSVLPSVSRRRVRALHNGEVHRVDYEEMRALEEVRAEEELNRARRQIAADANLLAAHYAKTGSPLDRDALLAVGRLRGLVGLSGDGDDAR